VDRARGARRRDPAAAWLATVVLGSRCPRALVLLVARGVRLARSAALDTSAIAGRNRRRGASAFAGLARNLLTLSGGCVARRRAVAGSDRR
jgi:hypothetical protein